MEFDQILHMPLYWEDLGWDYYKSIFADLTKFCVCIDIDKNYVGIVTRQFSQTYNRVMALD